MVHSVKKTYFPVHVTTENNYFSQGVVSLLTELFEDEYSEKISISLVEEPGEADLIVKIQSPGEKVFDWVDCDQFRTQSDYKHALLSKKWVSVYPRNEHYDRNFHCPVVSSVITMRNSVATIRRKLFILFFSDLMCGPPDLRKPNCNKCPGAYQLGWREQLMLGYLIQGLGHNEISQRMNCSIKALSSYRRTIMRKVNIKNYSDFVLWLGTKSVSDKFSEAVNCHAHEVSDDQLIWKTKLSDETSELSDDKERVLQSIKLLTRKRLRVNKLDNEVWLTTREIANEMDTSIYSMRYLLCQMEMTGVVISIKTGKGRSHTLRWKLAS
ncbi:LuxR C-terminal-related transcriptional regulator [Klebsiella grimontii]|uniref:LuxR C-terminal-related transcriptional regulator n=1 Tax=Klebsiella grimontii TaxID=2058152 RepID=UPI001CCF8999|nr:LuxR C-terminal-related transcriptional regulator [Klebsiella grimontii]MBZ7661738.1 LuxR family transcriptional regulator [Klebsiella grimontii]